MKLSRRISVFSYRSGPVKWTFMQACGSGSVNKTSWARRLFQVSNRNNNEKEMNDI
jgi:hypothetical protein